MALPVSLSENVLTPSLAAALDKAAGRGRRTLVSVTQEVDAADPCAAVFASRLASDRWFCWEQPDRGFALAGLGVAHEASSRGDSRFGYVAEECLRIGSGAVLDEPRGLPAGAGPVWLGGFAFDPDGGSTPTWSSLSPASLVLPELSICRSGGHSFLSVNAVVKPGEDVRAAGGEPHGSVRLAAPRNAAASDRPPPDGPRRHSQRPPAARVRSRGRGRHIPDRRRRDEQGRPRPRGDRQRRRRP